MAFDWVYHFYEFGVKGRMFLVASSWNHCLHNVHTVSMHLKAILGAACISFFVILCKHWMKGVEKKMGERAKFERMITMGQENRNQC